MFHVYVRAEDGTHELQKDIPTFEAAKEFALEWLGDNYTQIGEREYVSVWGSVLTIEERPSISDAAKQVLSAIGYSWSTWPQQLWWEANVPNVHPYRYLVPHDPFMEATLKGLTFEQVSIAVDELLEKGMIRAKAPTEDWSNLHSRGRWWAEKWVKERGTEPPDVWAEAPYNFYEEIE